MPGLAEQPVVDLSRGLIGISVASMLYALACVSCELSLLSKSPLCSEPEVNGG